MIKIIISVFVLSLLLSSSILGVNAFKMENLLSKKQDFIISNDFDSSDPFDGYILYTPLRSKITYLINIPYTLYIPHCPNSLATPELILG